jgi:hypothetical protein
VYLRLFIKCLNEFECIYNLLAMYLNVFIIYLNVFEYI